MKEFSITFVGDVMQHNERLPVNQDYKEIYRLPNFNTDYLIGNLEASFCGVSNGFPTFSSPDSFLCFLAEYGFNGFTLANDRCLDFNEWGLINTMNKLSDKNIGFTGCHRKGKSSPIIIDTDDHKIGIINFSFVPGKYRGAALIDCSVNFIHVAHIADMVDRARSEGCTYIILYLHWGIKYKIQPSFFQMDLVRKLEGCNIDYILGSHPHMVQPTQSSNGKYVTYSLGNFIHKPNPKEFLSNLSLAVKLIFTNDEIRNEMIPLYNWINDDGIYNVRELENVDIEELPDIATVTNYQKCCNHYYSNLQHITGIKRNQGKIPEMAEYKEMTRR